MLGLLELLLLLLRRRAAAAAAGYCCGPYDLDGSYNIAMVAGL